MKLNRELTWVDFRYERCLDTSVEWLGMETMSAKRKIMRAKTTEKLSMEHGCVLETLWHLQLSENEVQKKHLKEELRQLRRGVVRWQQGKEQKAINY